MFAVLTLCGYCTLVKSVDSVFARLVALSSYISILRILEGISRGYLLGAITSMLE